MKEKEIPLFDGLNLFSQVEYIKGKLNYDKYSCITAIVPSSSMI